MTKVPLHNKQDNENIKKWYQIYNATQHGEVQGVKQQFLKKTHSSHNSLSFKLPKKAKKESTFISNTSFAAKERGNVKLKLKHFLHNQYQTNLHFDQETAK